jgi:hypothetical protein
MSALGHSPIGVSFNDKTFLISMHADHRPQDVYFARTQSRAFGELAWKSRLKPWRSWIELARWFVIGVLVVAASTSLIL